MGDGYPIELPKLAVAAREAGEGSYDVVAERFAVSGRTLVRWVARGRELGSVAPFDKAGGWRSPVDLEALHAVARDKPDRTSDELTREYNRRVPRAARVDRSSVMRALRRCGYVFKKNVRGRQKPIATTGAPSGSRTSSGRRR